MLHLLLPRCIKFLAAITTTQWDVIKAAAAVCPAGFCSALLEIEVSIQAMTKAWGKVTEDGSYYIAPLKLASLLEQVFWENKPPLSRHG